MGECGGGEPTFYDYGNAPEVLIEQKAIPAWEYLECGLVRVFVCKEIQHKLVLDHTDLMTPAVMMAIGKRFIEIATAAKGQAGKVPANIMIEMVH